MLKIPIEKPSLVINCTIIVPNLMFQKLNCANFHQSSDPSKQAAAKRSDQRAQKQRLCDTDPKRFAEIMRTVQNASDSQFVFDCFDGTKKEQSDMAFLTVIRNYNKKHKGNPITKTTLINAIKQLKQVGYKHSKIYQPSKSNPTKHDNMWGHEWHVPLQTVFGKDASDYEWTYGDRIYFKLVFQSEPTPGGNYDPNGEIYVDSFHRDSDSAMLDDTTGKTSSWWSDDTGDDDERESMRQEGLAAREEITGLGKGKTEDKV